MGEEQESEAPPPKGQVLLDDTCVPAKITYSMDRNLLNDAREKTEVIIGHMHVCRTTPKNKSRTSRQNARQAYLCVVKAKNPGKQKFRRGIGKPLRFLRRNLDSIASLAYGGLAVTLPSKRYR